MLFNTKLFNTGMLNGGTTIATVYSTDTLVFENFSLSDGSTMIMTDLIVSGPTREIVGGPMPRGDGQYVTADYFREYTIEARGIVKMGTLALLDAQIDTIKKKLRTREGNLDYIDGNGTVKRFIATVDNFEEMFAARQRYHVTICPFVIRFKCMTPFGKSRTITSTSLSITSSPTVQSVVNAGTYKAQPIVTLLFSAASSVTVVNIANTTKGESIQYSGSVAANDILVFNSEQKTVTKNGTAVDFTGAFPSVDPGGNLMTVTITATSFTAYTTFTHRDTYL